MNVRSAWRLRRADFKWSRARFDPFPDARIDRGCRRPRGSSRQRWRSVGGVKSMKMENELKAPRAGTIGHIHISAGDSVEQNEVSITLA